MAKAIIIWKRKIKIVLDCSPKDKIHIDETMLLSVNKIGHFFLTEKFQLINIDKMRERENYHQNITTRTLS